MNYTYKNMSKRIKIALMLIIFCLIGSLIFLIIHFHVKDNDSNDIKIRTPQCEIEINKNDLIPLEKDESIQTRQLENEEEFKEFKIYLDLEYIKYQASSDPNLMKHFDKVINAMNKAKTTLEKLYLVKPFVTRWIVRAEVLENLGIQKFNEHFFKRKGEESRNLKDIGYDLYIFPKFGEIKALGSWGIYYKDTNYRPMITKMTLSTNFDFEKNGSEKYLNVFFLHYFTHLLGFSGTYIQDYFPKNTYVIKKDKFNIERHYIESKKVVETAKKYFNCSYITGVELDNKGIINGVSIHWEPRILLGDYMASFGIEYEEQAISEITLSLMEDSGWYKANYYTGGLMRFGKNKGCDFVFEKCVNQETHKTSFLNEFFDEVYRDRFTPSCTSGRQSRNYKAFYTFSSSIPEDFQYFEEKTKGGSSSYADYCPIMDSLKKEMENDYYVGNCKNGADIYGYNARYIHLINNKFYYGIKNSELPKEFGETLNYDNSFCVINSLVLKEKASNYKYNYTAPRAMCHEMFCSERSLTIKINNNYIICPRQGGKVEIEGYFGFLLCPDYNLICTGSIMCNDLFDCVDQKSLVKTPIYDYIINTSQDYGKEENKAPIEAYEESSNGFCPKDCGICNEKKECLKEKPTISPIIPTTIPTTVPTTMPTTIPTTIYVNKCTLLDPNCLECSEDNKYCIKCQNNFYLYQSKCYEIKFGFTVGKTYRTCRSYMSGCISCITDKICTKCDYDYVLEYSTNKCRRPGALEKKYFYDPKDDTYKNCDYKIANCYYCSNSDFCYRCNSGYHSLENGLGEYDHKRCYSNSDIPNRYSFYNKNTTHYPLCSSKLDGCYSCNTVGSICRSCLPGYKHYQRKYCTWQGGSNNYCPDNIANCNKCSDGKCIECNYGFSLDVKNPGKCFPTPHNNNYYYDDTLKTYIKCLDSPYLERCLACKDSKTCIQCDSRSHTLSNGKCIRISY